MYWSTDPLSFVGNSNICGCLKIKQHVWLSKQQEQRYQHIPAQLNHVAGQTCKNSKVSKCLKIKQHIPNKTIHCGTNNIENMEKQLHLQMLENKIAQLTFKIAKIALLAYFCSAESFHWSNISVSVHPRCYGKGQDKMQFFHLLSQLNHVSCQTCKNSKVCRFLKPKQHISSHVLVYRFTQVCEKQQHLQMLENKIAHLAFKVARIALLAYFCSAESCRWSNIRVSVHPQCDGKGQDKLQFFHFPAKLNKVTGQTCKNSKVCRFLKQKQHISYHVSLQIHSAL